MALSGRFAALACGLVLPCSVGASELIVTLESSTAVRVYEPHRVQKSQNRIELEADVSLSHGIRAYADGWLLLDPAGRLVGPAPDFGQDPIDRWQVGGSREFEAELRELYLEGQTQLGSTMVNLRVGKQQVVWGQSFGLRVLDIVNAQDLREFILDEFNRSRTPVFGARLDVTAYGWALQGLVFPDFEPDSLPDFESEFALDPSLDGFLPRLARVQEPLGDVLILSQTTNRPRDWTGQATGYGLSVGGTIRGVDAALYYWDRPDPRPLVTRGIESVNLGQEGYLGNRIRSEHKRVRSVGFSAAAPLRDFALWSEGAVSTGRGFVVDDLSDPDGFVRRDDLQVAVGLDWNGWGPLFANAQVIEFGVFGDKSKLSLDPWRTYLSLLLRFDFRGDTVLPQFFAIVGADEGDLLLRSSLEWKATDGFSVVAGVDWFSGPRPTLFGQYAHDRACVPIPAQFATPGLARCYWEPQPGRPSRVFLTFRYAFSFGR